MKSIKSVFTIIIISLAIIFSSCKKNDNTSLDSSGGGGSTQTTYNAVFLSRKQAMITNTSLFLLVILVQLSFQQAHWQIIVLWLAH